MVMTLNTQFRSVVLSLAVVLLGTACSDNSSNPSDDLKGNSGFRLLEPNGPDDITPDGSVALIEDRNGGAIYQFHVATGALTKVTQVTSFQAFTTGISSDLRISANYNVSNSDTTAAAVWAAGSDWTRMATAYDAACDIFIGGAWDISADGHTMTGFNYDGCSTVGYRWSDASGSWVGTPLEVLGAGSNRATNISDDGQVIGGSVSTDLVDRWPAIWHADGTGSLLTSGISADSPGEVLALNTDGSVAAGTWGGQAFIWKDGVTTIIPNMKTPPADFGGGKATAISLNGDLMFGTTFDVAFVWTAAAGERSLRDVAIAAGVSIPSRITLLNATAASVDGTVVIGQAMNPNLQTYTYVLKLPVSAYGL